MALEFWVKGKIEDNVYVHFALSKGCTIHIHLHFSSTLPFLLLHINKDTSCLVYEFLCETKNFV